MCREGEEIEYAHCEIHQREWLVLIRLGIHLAGEIVNEAVEREERGISE